MLLDNLRELMVDCAKIDHKAHTKFAKNTNINRYIVYDNSKTIQYLNLDNEVIGMAKISTHGTQKKMSSVKVKTLKTIKNTTQS